MKLTFDGVYFTKSESCFNLIRKTSMRKPKAFPRSLPEGCPGSEDGRGINGGG